ncbi:MAG: hypothetical protein ACSLE1_02750 [Sphingobium sp.]
MRIGNYVAKTFRCIAIIFVSVAAVVGIFLAILLTKIHFETEEKIRKALEQGYPNAIINERVEWDYGRQICFDITLHPPPKSAVPRKVVMVSGDDDGGTWGLGRREYKSINECKSEFYHG